MALKIKIGIIGGTGLDDPKIFEDKKEIYVDTPYGPPSDAIVEGTISQIPCALLARHGRKHNIMPHTINYQANIWALKSVGCTHILVTSACGSLKEEIPPGCFVILDNVIDRTCGRKQTLYDGTNPDAKGICHIPMEPVFCPRTRKVLIKAIHNLGFKCIDGGTCVTIQGPRFSTKAESNVYRSWGSDIINMTVMPEVVLAKEAGICYANLSVVTDYDCWRDAGENVNASDVVEMFKKNVDKIKSIIVEAVKIIASEDWTETTNDLQNVIKSAIMY